MIPAVLERCAGIDVHKRFVTVCVLIGAAHLNPEPKVRRYGTCNADLRQLRDWLKQENCWQVAMESTGPYWKPVFNVLEEAGFEVILANPQQVKNLRGHKTDMKDCRWLAHLLRHGMIRPSYIPSRAIRELRDLTRRRKQLIRNGAMERNRVQKVLEEANIKIGSVLSDVFGASGQDMLLALVQGKATAQEIAQLAKRQARKKIPELEAALEGHCMSESQRQLIRQCMSHLAFLDKQIEEINGQIQDKIGAFGFQESYELLQSITGIKREAAATVLAEVGDTVAAFPSSSKLSSWAGVCPGNNESGGKRKSTRTTKGNPYLRDVLLECAWAASRTKSSQMQRLYQRLERRLGHKRAIVAVAHALVEAIYFVLSQRRRFVDIVEPPHSVVRIKRLVRHHTRRLHKLDRWLDQLTEGSEGSAMQSQPLT